ncbi:MAG TPA: tetraacyldisaccharide 4'-kinase [Chthonomonadales bacterium]|nr:tetraacyldisaccharide 4'-kinase [Chthonomonadales bacterium]
MNAENYLVSVIHGRRGPAAAVLRAALSAPALAYAAGLELYLALYRVGIKNRLRLPCPVVSIGNLCSGGVGKTPTTIALCGRLVERGLRPAVLSRGYRGKLERSCGVVSDGARLLLTPASAGDEPFLLAESLPGVPVLVGKDRRRTGALAWERFQPDVILLDDGMQYWQLHRDLDIVLLNAENPLDNGWVLPRGLLREPPFHLGRAGAIVLTNTRAMNRSALQSTQVGIQRLAPKAPLFLADYRATGLTGIGAASHKPVGWLAGKRVALVSGIGNPTSFERMITEQGAQIAFRAHFPDHHRMPGAELEQAVVSGATSGAEMVICTAKDAVKLKAVDYSLPVYCLDVAMEVTGAESLLGMVEALISKRSTPNLELPCLTEVHRAGGGR